MNVAEELKERGLVEQTSADLPEILGKQRTIYIGIDPTADSMHVGHLVWILLMKRLGAAGHKLIFIVGGGTGMIGDPKANSERPLMDTAAVKNNTRSLAAQLKSILGNTSFRMVDNADWLLKEGLIDFLRDIGKHFTVNDLIKRDTIKKRLDTADESISYTEFTYALLQGFDFLMLYKKYGCDVQIGASDQWTNILSGVDLIRKKESGQAFAYTIPLVTDANGKKFGKSEGNAIWLDPKQTSPYAFYQFWLNQPDSVVGTYLKFYTFMPVREIDMLMEMHGRNPSKREAQRMLARSVTEIVHGADAAKRSEAVSQALYGERALNSLTREELNVVLTDAPSARVTLGMPVIDALMLAGLVTSKSDARRLIEASGVVLNDQRVESADAVLGPEHFDGQLALLRRGKQTAVLVRS